MRHVTRSKGNSTLTKLAELSIAAPQVVAIRTAQMLAAGATPNARQSAEFSRMGTEKVAAFGESMLGMGRQVMKTNQEYTRSIFIRLMRMWMTPWWLGAYRPVTQTIASMPTAASLLTPTRAQQQRAVTQLVAKAVAPVHKRATANARRLLAKAAAPARKRTSASAKRRSSAKKRSRA
jgi:hypothetical protein